MPVTLNVGYSRKIGEPNYGSRGASVSLQIEKELSLEDRDLVSEQIGELFGLARAAVEAELSREDAVPAVQRPVNGHTPPPLITPNQLQAIRSLSQRKQVNLKAVLQSQCGASSLEQLTRQQASRLISELNSQPGAA